MTKTIFWVFIGVVFYVYFVYPLLLIVLSGFVKRPVKKGDIEPSLSMIIAAYNEEECIRQKLENSLTLDYPKDKLEIIVASDGSADRTNEIAKQFKNQGVKLVCHSLHRGKASIQNDAVKKAQGEIIVFSDATGIYNKNCLREIVANFTDRSVGSVAGALYDINLKSGTVSKTNNIYWNYETFLRKKESDVGVLTMASGSIYAIRHALFKSLDRCVSDDFVLPMEVVKKGYRNVFEQKAISFEKIQCEISSKFRQKLRILVLDLNGLFLNRNLLNPFKFPLISVALISHKLLRWCVPFFLLGIFLYNIFLLDIIIYQILFISQLFFCAIAIMGYFFILKGSKGKILFIPFYFCLLNIAALIAWAKFLCGIRIANWETERQVNG